MRLTKRIIGAVLLISSLAGPTALRAQQTLTLEDCRRMATEGNKELGYEECPVINLTKDVDKICSSIEYVIANREKIEEWGYKSRKFVEKYHSYKDIAQQYVECWMNS